MATKLINLTTPDQIIDEFVRQGGRYALSKYAKVASFSIYVLSMHVHGKRKNPAVLQEIANHLGCGVYGVFPENHKEAA